MDFSRPATTQAFADEVEQFVAEHVTHDVVERALTTGTIHDAGLHRAMAERRWVAAMWPESEGGAGLTTTESMILVDRLHDAGAPLDGWFTTMCAASVIKAKGTDAQRAEVIPAVARGEALMALGFSEPESGSDVASARTKAVRDGDDWIISGQKMFTTMAHVARWVLLLCRTNTEVAKHRGLTMFLVPLDAPGVVIHPVHTFGGERTNVTFYSDVRVPDSARVGELDGGWEVLTYSLTSERGSAFGATSMFLGSARQVIDEVTAWARATERDGRPVAEDRDARRRIARAEIDLEVARLLNQRSIAIADGGRTPDVEAAHGKLFATETLQRTCSDLLDLMGEDGLLDHTAPGAPRAGLVEHAFRQSAVTTIYGGSSEVMRNIISQRGLGMPRG